MGIRGRKSTASMAVAGFTLAGASTSRLTAPVHMSDAEQIVWASLVNDHPADFFTITHAPMIEAYCRHVVQGRILADELATFDRAWMADDDGLKRYDKLLAMHERENRAASSLATRMRITKQAIDQQTVARKLVNTAKGRKPWELAIEG